MGPRYGPAGARGHPITDARPSGDEDQAASAAGGPQIFGDPDARFADLLALIIDTAARLSPR
jgi:hypothetical protein